MDKPMDRETYEKEVRHKISYLESALNGTPESMTNRLLVELLKQVSFLTKLQIPEEPKPSKIMAFRLAVKSEPYQLPYYELKYQSVNFMFPAANTSDIYLADNYLSAKDDNKRYVLPLAGGSERMKLTNLNELWYYGGTVGDYLYVIAEVIVPKNE